MSQAAACFTPRPPGEQRDLETIIATMLEIWDRLAEGGRMEVFIEKKRGSLRPKAKINEPHFPLEDSAA